MHHRTELPKRRLLGSENFDLFYPALTNFYPLVMVFGIDFI
jgi:hypothetical protein